MFFENKETSKLAINALASILNTLWNYKVKEEKL